MCLESFEKELDNTEFRTYKKRLLSFKQWKAKLSPLELALSGFYHLCGGDVCKCYYCGVEIFNWEDDDDPIEEHYRLSLNCDLAECLWLFNKCRFKKNVIDDKEVKTFKYSFYTMATILILFVSLIFLML